MRHVIARRDMLFLQLTIAQSQSPVTFWWFYLVITCGVSMSPSGALLKNMASIKPKYTVLNGKAIGYHPWRLRDGLLR